MKRQELVSTVEVRDENGQVVGTKEVVRYAELLSQAHDEGLKRIETALVQLPTPENGMVAVATARVETEKGVFCGAADASPENVDARLTRYVVALAETRAKARALRDAVNVGVVALEEFLSEEGALGPLDATTAISEPARGQPGPFSPPRSQSRPPEGDQAKMSDAQRRYLFRLLAERDIRGEDAEQYLKEAFATDSLNAVSKSLASGLIERLIKEGQS